MHHCAGKKNIFMLGKNLSCMPCIDIGIGRYRCAYAPTYTYDAYTYGYIRMAGGESKRREDADN